MRIWTAAALFVPGALLAISLASCENLTGDRGGETTGTQPDTSAAAMLAQGEYISVIAGCNDCHTPGAFYGDPDEARLLSGSDIGWQGPWGTSYAPNLTPDVATGIGSWTEDQIMAAVRTGQRPDGRRLAPPMPWPMYSRLTDYDARSLARYLKSLPAVQHEAPGPFAPGQRAPSPIIVVPPPSPWDAPRGPAHGDTTGADTSSV